MSSDITTQSNHGFMAVSTLEQAIQCSQLIAKSNFCPPSLIGKPGDILVALQMGQELGLKPLQSLQNISVINGRPSLWGDAMLAVCRGNPEFRYIEETYDAATETAKCVVQRGEEPEVIAKFSMADAKKAGLLGKKGPWETYPQRMLKMRARGWALRDAFPDTLRGICIEEEAKDMPPPKRQEKVIKEEVTQLENQPVMINGIQLNALKQKIESSGSDESKILSYLKLKSLEEMTTEDWIHICEGLDKKIEASKAKEQVVYDFSDEEDDAHDE